MPYKYIYIDDTLDQIERGTINGIKRGEKIEVKFKHPNNWEKLINDLVVELEVSDGLILDLRLNDKPYAEDSYAKYRGSTVAQELRTLVKEKDEVKKDFPIVLISANEKIEESLDETSLDLFDAIINKNLLGSDHGPSFDNFRENLVSLATGYIMLNKSKRKIAAILNYNKSDLLDTRFLDTFQNIVIDQPIHVIARFIINQLLKKPTFLINENVLAARLGVNLTSSSDWPKLRDETLVNFRYQGPFHDYYQRWWMPEIELWWAEVVSPDVDLRNLCAKDRVEILKNKFLLNNINPLQKSEKSKSDAFWTVCKVTGIAIDTLDSFVIAGQDNNYAWQEKEIISIEEALRPTQILKWKDVASLEKNRLQKLKDFYGRTEQRVRR